MSIWTQIQKTAKAQVKGLGVKLIIGEVATTSPFSVKINDKLPLTKELLIFPEHLQEQMLQIKDFKTYVIQPKLKIGDKLMLSVVGEEYFIIDKVGDPDVTITYTEE